MICVQWYVLLFYMVFGWIGFCFVIWKILYRISGLAKTEKDIEKSEKILKILKEVKKEKKKKKVKKNELREKSQD